MSSPLTRTTTVSAAKAGFSPATGYRIEADPRLPSQKKAPRGRRRPDPLADVWDAEILPILKAAPGLRAIAVLAEIRRRHPEIGPGIRRTLERRMRAWWARRTGTRRRVPTGSPAWPSRFVRLHRHEGARGDDRRRPARASPVSLPPRLLGLCACPCRAWRRELYGAGRGHLQNALWALGGVPLEHRSDSLSAAFRNMDREAQEDLTQPTRSSCATTL
jgi:hypothetical protein